MSRLRLYTDENVPPVVAEQLLRHGYDALSCLAAGNSNLRLSDDWQLSFATEQQRAILTFNIDHFYEVDARWRRREREHSGIIIVTATTPIRELIRRAMLHLDTVTAEQQYNTILYLTQ